MPTKKSLRAPQASGDVVIAEHGPVLTESRDADAAEALCYDEVLRRAYQIWEEEGRPHGRHLDHWFAAEHEVRGSDEG